jgi:protein disulfide-isomerase A6
MQEAEELLDGLAVEVKPRGEAYIKLMRKIMEKGKSYVATELARLDGLISSESIAKAKKGDFQLRRNILNAFAPASA